MATVMDEKEQTQYEEHEDVGKDIVEIKTVKGNEAFNAAMIKEPPEAFSYVSLVLYASAFIGFLCSTMNGYDGSLLNVLLSNDAFLANFNGTDDGIWAGIVSSMYQIGGVVALPFVGPAVDTWGRRAGMFIGAMTIIVGTVIQGTTSATGSLGQFMAGRFLLGFGVSIAASAGPIYVVEMSHPAYRGVVTALYNTFWFTGAIISAGAGRGAISTGPTSSWLIPVWLQLLCSGVIVICAFILPESPRWLYVHNRYERAKAMMTKYHGNGNPNSVWVDLQLREYEEFLELNGADKRWWDYRALFTKRSSVYRLGCNVVISIFGQWAGNAVLSYFLSAVLETAGITDTTEKLNITLIQSCIQFVFAIVGAFLVERVGRRPLLLFANFGCSVVWLGITVATSQFVSNPGDPGSAKAVQALIYIFGIVYSVGFTPLQALYPVEVLSFEMRAKGMAFSSLAVNAGGLLNQFAWPVSLAAIGWRTYIIFTIWCSIQGVVIYFFIPETKARTLEELDIIFEAPNPRQASLERKQLALDSSMNVVKVDVA
ncbi:hypothetical protein MMC10_004720 [Thelotrema lepadinum]|nr:hypothetical protein [Thelotrema lepadinum]